LGKLHHLLRDTEYGAGSSTDAEERIGVKKGREENIRQNKYLGVSHFHSPSSCLLAIHAIPVSSCCGYEVPKAVIIRLFDNDVWIQK
jgi:hypothetical protein